MTDLSGNRVRGTIFQQVKRYLPLYPVLKQVRLNPATHRELVGFLPTRTGELLVVFDLERLSTEARWHDKITHTGTRTLTLDADGTRVLDDVTEWLPVNQTVTAKVGMTESEYLDHAAWEESCYRPGTSRAPLDSWWARNSMTRADDPDFYRDRQRPTTKPKKGTKP